eukprot:3277264-Prymnesium_polylepis.2
MEGLNSRVPGAHQLDDASAFLAHEPESGAVAPQLPFLVRVAAERVDLESVRRREVQTSGLERCKGDSKGRAVTYTLEWAVASIDGMAAAYDQQGNSPQLMNVRRDGTRQCESRDLP